MADSWGGRAGNRIPPPRRGVRAGRGWGRPRRWGAPTGRDGRPPRLRRSRGTGTCSSRPAPRRSPPAAERPPLRPPQAAADGGERCPAIAVMRRDAGGGRPARAIRGPVAVLRLIVRGQRGAEATAVPPPTPPPAAPRRRSGTGGGGPGRAPGGRDGDGSEPRPRGAAGGGREGEGAAGPEPPGTAPGRNAAALLKPKARCCTPQEPPRCTPWPRTSAPPPPSMVLHPTVRPLTPLNTTCGVSPCLSAVPPPLPALILGGADPPAALHPKVWVGRGLSGMPPPIFPLEDPRRTPSLICATPSPIKDV